MNFCTIVLLYCCTVMQKEKCYAPLIQEKTLLACPGPMARSSFKLSNLILNVICCRFWLGSSPFKKEKERLELSHNTRQDSFNTHQFHIIFKPIAPPPPPPEGPTLGIWPLLGENFAPHPLKKALWLRLFKMFVIWELYVYKHKQIVTIFSASWLILFKLFTIHLFQYLLFI